MSSLHSCPQSAPRPSEKVLQFFWENLFPAHTVSGKRLPTIREIARHLEVSASTVQAVFAQLAKEGLLTMTIGRGTFVNQRAADHARVANTSSHRVLTIASWENELAKPQMTWGKGVSAGVLHETAKNGAGLMVNMFFVDKLGADSNSVEEVAKQTHAAIVFPHLHSNTGLIAAFQHREKPVVYINPPTPISSRNFVGPNYFRAAYGIAQALRDSGRRHLTLLFHRKLTENSQCAAMLAGVTAAVCPTTNTEGLKLSYNTFPHGIPAGLDDYLDALFSQPDPPDAIYTSEDNLAESTLQWLLRRGIAVPEQVSVICGTGVYPSDAFSIPCTAVQTPLEQIGRNAVKMVVELIENDNRSLPGVWLDVDFVCRQTTTAEENRFLAEFFKSS